MSIPKKIASFITCVFELESSSAIKLLKEIVAESDDLAARLIRVAVVCPGHTAMYYQQLHNLWCKLQRPALKPNSRCAKSVVVTDFTADPLVKPLQLFAASRGVDIEIDLPGFDSVEPELLNPLSNIYQADYDLLIVVLSEHWLTKYIGHDAIVSPDVVGELLDTLRALLETATDNFKGNVVFANMFDGANPPVCGFIDSTIGLGRGVIQEKVNSLLREFVGDKLAVCDLKAAIHLAGGAKELGRRSYYLAKMAYEPDGAVAVAREMASAISDIYGQTHRVCALDWDNTLWGGEIAELGVHGVVCGYDGPEANGYRLLQEYFKGLIRTGAVLAAVSRNDPKVIDLLKESDELKLSKSDFSSVQINFVPKSDSIAGVVEDLNFGAEYVLFIDDSSFELTEVLLANPYIDILRAEKDPEFTLRRVCESRFFNRVSIKQDDLDRKGNFENLQKQKAHSKKFKSNDDFLASINITLTIERYSEKNQSRVLQLLKKTNQFNLTTRRHDESGLDELLESNADVWVFGYEDSFGSQGIIALVILVPELESYRIDTWLMSCRVLNRTVEQGMLAWLYGRYPKRSLIGEYYPTEKNALVADHYERLGFVPAKESGRWRSDVSPEVPKHHIFEFIERF